MCSEPIQIRANHANANAEIRIQNGFLSFIEPRPSWPTQSLQHETFNEISEIFQSERAKKADDSCLAALAVYPNQQIKTCRISLEKPQGCQGRQPCARTTFGGL
jgi:hypothetical protein